MSFSSASNCYSSTFSYSSEIKRNYECYNQVRTYVMKQLAERKTIYTENFPSKYWAEELSGFDYMLEASPLLVNKLRQQTYHITGLKHFEYRSSQVNFKKRFINKLQVLKDLDPSYGELFIPEPKILGGFGHEIDGKLVNLDTLKFYESLIFLEKGGLLTKMRNKRCPLVCEIGSGWGGFAYQFKSVVPHATYVLIDFPEVFMFSATYLKVAFPQHKFLFVERESGKYLDNLDEYDFVFVPQHIFDCVWGWNIDLMINMVSFQEMTSEQVDNYVKKIAKKGCLNIYSHNRECSKHNQELSTVSEIIERYFDIRLLKYLTGSYTDLEAKIDKENGELGGNKENLGQRLKSKIKGVVCSSSSSVAKSQKLDRWGIRAADYHHFMGDSKN